MNSIELSKTVNRIKSKLSKLNTTLQEAINERGLYFRVSVIGRCNLKCPFCHNEGAPAQYEADIDFVEEAMKIATSLGFTRLQLTGGEPLLNTQIHLFVSTGKKYFSTVGITTNGSFLVAHLNALIEAGIDRIHLSLQEESIVNKANEWHVPHFLSHALSESKKGYFNLQVNLPVLPILIDRLPSYLELLRPYNCDIKLFSILPEKENFANYNVDILEHIALNENACRFNRGVYGNVFVRKFRQPSGIRCKSCTEFVKCKEQSHSLRLGADRILRPCLATRKWDIVLNNTISLREVEQAAYLALDYTW